MQNLSIRLRREAVLQVDAFPRPRFFKAA